MTFISKLATALGTLAFSTVPAVALTLASPDFTDGGTLPKSAACSELGGGNISPALQVSGLPKGAQFLTVIMDDPDAVAVAGKVWVHWNLSDIPAATTSIPPAKKGAVGVGVTGSGDSGKGYGGACPPATHTYTLTVYATSAPVGKLSKTTRKSFEKKFGATILGQATLSASYP